MKHTSTHTVIISILTGILLLSLSVWVFLIIQSNSIKSENSNVEAKIITGGAHESYLNSIRTVLKRSKNELAIIHGQFIKKDNVSEFISLLEAEALANNLDTDFSSIDSTPKDALRDTLKIRITSSGTWIHTMRFIKMLESLPYASKIEELTLVKEADPEKKTFVWKTNINLVAYVLHTN